MRRRRVSAAPGACSSRRWPASYARLVTTTTTLTIRPSTPAMPDVRLHGEAIVYRLYDVGCAIQLDQACELLASSAPERLRPVRGEAQAIQILNPPVTIGLAMIKR